MNNQNKIDHQYDRRTLFHEQSKSKTNFLTIQSPLQTKQSFYQAPNLSKVNQQNSTIVYNQCKIRNEQQYYMVNQAPISGMHSYNQNSQKKKFQITSTQWDSVAIGQNDDSIFSKINVVSSNTKSNNSKRIPLQQIHQLKQTNFEKLNSISHCNKQYNFVVEEQYRLTKPVIISQNIIQAHIKLITTKNQHYSQTQSQFYTQTNNYLQEIDREYC